MQECLYTYAETKQKNINFIVLTIKRVTHSLKKKYVCCCKQNHGKRFSNEKKNTNSNSKLLVMRRSVCAVMQPSYTGWPKKHGWMT
jgi:hypothetical protein